MFWLGVLIGLFAGTNIGFLAFGLCRMLSRLEDGEQIVPDGYGIDGREPTYQE